MSVHFSHTMRRIIAAVSAVAALGSMAACGSSDSSSASSDNQLTISYWGTEMDSIKALIKKYPDIKVKQIRVTGDDYNVKLNQMVVGGDAPDLMLIQEADYVRFAKNGVLLKLDDKLKDLGINANDMQPAIRQISDQADGYYGFPQGLATEVLYYNKDMFDAAGVSYPTNDWTWDDYEAAAKKLTNSATGQYGSDSPSMNGVWYSLIGSAGDAVVKNSKLSFGNGLTQTLQWQKKLVDEKVQPQPNGGTKVTDLFAAGKAAMTMGGSWMVSTYKDADFNWDFTTIPAPKGGRKYNSMHTSFWGISAKSKKQDLALKALKFLESKEGQKVMSEDLGNLPVFKSMMSDGYYRKQGKHGPSTWETLDQAAEQSRFGYTLVSSTPTTDLYNQFNAYVLGQTSLKEVTGTQVDKANKEITDAQ